MWHVEWMVCTLWEHWQMCVLCHCPINSHCLTCTQINNMEWHKGDKRRAGYLLIPSDLSKSCRPFSSSRLSSLSSSSDSVRPGPYLVCTAPSRPSNTSGPSSLSSWFSVHPAHLIHPAHSDHHKTSSSCHSVNRFVFRFWICLSCLSDVDMLSNGKGTHPMALSLFISWLMDLLKILYSQNKPPICVIIGPSW